MLNSLKDFKVTSIGSTVLAERPVDEAGNIDWNEFDVLRKSSPIFIDHEVDMVSFKLMTKPASEGGEGGQWTDMVEVGIHMLKYLNAKFPCRENAITITKLEEALMWQKKRTEDRQNRNVEGKNEK